MSADRIVAIASQTVHSVRETSVSPYAEHPTHREVARGLGPCRHCLQSFEVGKDERILFTYDPFASLGARPLPGPVFVHSQPCERYPEHGGIPEIVKSRSMTIFGYSRPRILVGERTCGPGEIETAIEELFRSPEVHYIHVHDTEAGCYDFRVERVPSC